MEGPLSREVIYLVVVQAKIVFKFVKLKLAGFKLLLLAGGRCLQMVVACRWSLLAGGC
jgi:hypothetical protein